jgi:hypothetical protein
MDGNTVRPTRHEGSWLVDGTLDTVLEINQQCLEFVLEMGPSAPTLAGMPERFWAAFSPESRASLAASPYLLADARFDDEQRWDDPTRMFDPALSSSLADPLFVGAGAHDFIRRVLMFGWHMARAHPHHARIVLGMNAVTADHVGRFRLKDLDRLAIHCPGCVRLRWERQPRMWQHVLRRSVLPGCEALSRPGLRGLQLMAGITLGQGR